MNYQSYSTPYFFKEDENNIVKVVLNQEREIYDLKEAMKCLLLELDKHKVPGNWVEIKEKYVPDLPGTLNELYKAMDSINDKLLGFISLTPYEQKVRDNFRMLQRLLTEKEHSNNQHNERN